MKIRHERPQSDLSFQVRAPLSLELVSGEVVDIPEWSLDGFRFPGDSDVLPRKGTLSIPFQGVDIRFPVGLDVGPGERFLKFTGLTGRQRETLAVFYRSLLSGRMAATGEVITSLDTPVDLVPMGETEEEEAVATTGKSPRSLRAAFNVALYALLAALVFWTLGSGIYAKLSHVTIQNARIEAAMVPHVTVKEGYAERILVAPGAAVQAGDRLVEVSQPEDQAALAEVRGRITLIEKRLEQAQARAARIAVQLAQAREKLVLAATSPDPRVAELRRQNLDAFDNRLSRAHLPLFEAQDAVTREIDALTDELRRLRRERGNLRDAADALHIVARVDGFVSEIDVIEGEFLARGAAAVVVEEDTARLARGWVDQDMARALAPGMTVRVSYNAGFGLQSQQGAIVGLEAGIDPELTTDFGMLVTVALQDMSTEDTRSALPHLLPVELKAQRGWARGWQARASRLKAMVGL